jgi:hypothetical protein
MSKRVKVTITCPNCNNHFDYTLFRSIWGEYPENRELVMSDKINVAVCPHCKTSTKLLFPFIYTNAKQFFAVWWEPSYDPQIDKDKEGYERILGQNNYLATAPRIKEWDDFKQTILKFERGELNAEKGEISKEMKSQDDDFLKYMKKKNKKKSGCLPLFVFVLTIISGLIYSIWF